MTQPEGSIPGARLLLDQMVRLSDYQHRSVDESRVKSRAYLSVGALAVAAGIAFLAVPDTIAGAHPAVQNGVVAGAALALLLFGLSAACAVKAERATRLPDAPDTQDFTDLVIDEQQEWSHDQLAVWIALEYIDSVIPDADEIVDRIARLVDRQLIFFLVEMGVLGITLIVALVAGPDGEGDSLSSKHEAGAVMVAECWPALALAEAPVFPTLSVPVPAGRSCSWLHDAALRARSLAPRHEGGTAWPPLRSDSLMVRGVTPARPSSRAARGSGESSSRRSSRTARTPCSWRADQAARAAGCRCPG